MGIVITFDCERSRNRSPVVSCSKYALIMKVRIACMAVDLTHSSRSEITNPVLEISASATRQPRQVLPPSSQVLIVCLQVQLRSTILIAKVVRAFC